MLINQKISNASIEDLKSGLIEVMKNNKHFISIPFIPEIFINKLITQVSKLNFRKARPLVGNSVTQDFEVCFPAPREDAIDILARSIEKLFTETIDNVEMLDKKIESNLDNWTIDRLNVIDRLIIQMSITEMIFMKDFNISHKVTISSALENAKKFSSEDSTSFVNGVLDTIYKEL